MWVRPRVVRLRVSEILSGIAAGQSTVEVRTGQGWGDCGFHFEAGREYFVYASNDTDDGLQTNICTRTRPIDQAAEDLAYLRSMAGTPETGRITVRTASPHTAPAKAGRQIAVEAASGTDQRYVSVTRSDGSAVFDRLPPGRYRVHAVDDGVLPSDPEVWLGARGSLEVGLPPTLTIRGRVVTKQGQVPPQGVSIELVPISEPSAAGNSLGPGLDGHFDFRLTRPGRFYLGVNVNQPMTAQGPYTAWFHPGTSDPAAATVIEFAGKAGVRNMDLTLPDPQPTRIMEGVTLRTDGKVFPDIRLFAVDERSRLVGQAVADPQGRFQLTLPAGGSTGCMRCGRARGRSLQCPQSRSLSNRAGNRCNCRLC
jgi:hypothetical protein